MKDVLAIAFLAAVALTSARAMAGDPTEAIGVGNQDESERLVRLNALSLHLLSLGSGGLAIEGEHRVRSRVSFALGASVRASARGDYQSRAGATSLEFRFWPWSQRHQRRLWQFALVGAYIGARLDGGLTQTSERDSGRSLGSFATIAESITTGYRLSLWQRLEMTPSVAIGVRHEFDRRSRVPAWTRGSVGFALTLGAIF